MKRTVLITLLLFVTSAVMLAQKEHYQYAIISHTIWDKRNNEPIYLRLIARFIPEGDNFTKLNILLISQRDKRSIPTSVTLEDGATFIYPIVKGPVFNRTIEYVIPDRMDPENKVTIVKIKAKFKVTDDAMLPGMQIFKAKVTYRNMNDKYRAMVKGDTKKRTFRLDEKGRLIEFEDHQKNVYKL